jgi:putative ATP-dependent endonuclease of OLD family
VNRKTLVAPVQFKDCLEVFLGIPVSERDDKKPVEIMKAIASNAIDPARLQVLRCQFCTALAI